MAIRVEYLFFDMNSYFASVAQNEEPHLIGRPVGILTTDTPNAARLRRERLFTQVLTVSASPSDGPRQIGSLQMTSTQDTFLLLEGWQALWMDFNLHAPIASVSVTLSGLSQLETGDLFSQRDMGSPTSKERLCHALDGLNRRFGKDTIQFGRLPFHQVPFTGAKIAFSRVPDVADFHE